MLLGYIKWLFSKERKIPGKENLTEESVTITIDLDAEFGTQENKQYIKKLAEKISNIVQKNGLGEYDGDEFGDHEVSLYIYGKSANSIYDAIEHTIKECQLKPIRVTKMYLINKEPQFKKETVF